MLLWQRRINNWTHAETSRTRPPACHKVQETRSKIRPRSLPSAVCPTHFTMCDTDELVNKKRYARVRHVCAGSATEGCGNNRRQHAHSRRDNL